MHNNSDLQGILSDWKYDPSAINARWINGDDGRPKVQLRLDLGLLQMEITGRPDGQTPKGFNSLLECYLSVEETAAKKGAPFRLTVGECSELQQEAAQYYYRYISLYALRDFDRVILDTEHNIAIINLVARGAENQDAAWQLIQFYTYVRMMDARARAERAVERKAFDEAAEVLQLGIQEIRQFLKEYANDETGSSREINLLKELLNEIRNVQPKSDMQKLRDEMEEAIQCENYERAAALRDKINSLMVSSHHYPSYQC